jgi:hypothetical protein
MKVYVLSVIFSADQVKKQPYLLTSTENEELLPLIEISHTEFFHRELFHQLKSMFTQDSIKAESDCSYNFLTLQDELSVEYVFNHYDFVSKEDLIVTYGGILLKYKCLDQFKWTEYKLNTQHKGYSSDMNLNLLLDYVIQRSNL